MKKEHVKVLSKLQKDALKEISSITSGNATSSLSKLVNKKILIDIPKAEFLTLNALIKNLGGEKRMVMAIYLPVLGEINGQVLFLFQRNYAMDLIDLILQNKMGTTKILDHMAESAFGEMANIFTGTYLNALSNMLDLKILPGIPVVANDYVGPILEYSFGRIKSPESKILSFSTKIMIKEHNVEGDFIFMFNEKSYKLVLERLETLFDMAPK